MCWRFKPGESAKLAKTYLRDSQLVELASAKRIEIFLIDDIEQLQSKQDIAASTSPIDESWKSS